MLVILSKICNILLAILTTITVVSFVITLTTLSVWR